jgi:hypothetical protein
MPLAEPPPQDSRFGSPLKLPRVHWVRPEVVVEVTYLTWTEDNLLRQVSYQGSARTSPPRKWCARFHARLAVLPRPERRSSSLAPRRTPRVTRRSGSLRTVSSGRPTNPRLWWRHAPYFAPGWYWQLRSKCHGVRYAHGQTRRRV